MEKTEAPPLTDEELASVADGENWRTATCVECGRTVIVTPELGTFTSHCPSRQPPMSVEIDARPSPTRPLAQTRSGPTATERLVAEVRRLRNFQAEPDDDAEIAGPITEETILSFEEYSDELWRDSPQRGARSIIRRLIEEVRRLRSDEWLDKSAREISKTVGGIDGWRNAEKIEAILRKHRDGKACGIVGEPEAGRTVCELIAGHEGYHQQGGVRWLGYHPKP